MQNLVLCACTRFKTEIVEIFQTADGDATLQNIAMFLKKRTLANERISLAFCPAGESVDGNSHWVVGLEATSTSSR